MQEKRPIRPIKRGKTNNYKRYDNNNKNTSGNGRYLNLKEKYLSKASEALASGDRIEAEYYYQYADHYGRVEPKVSPVPNQ